MSRSSHRLVPACLALAGASLAVLGVVGVASGAVGASRTVESNSTTYTPSAASQDQSGPVISNIVVSSDDKTITFQINTPNRPSFTPDMDYEVFVDADNTPSTGNAKEGGADVLLTVSAFTHPASLARSFWDGTGWGSAPVGADETWAYSDGVTITLPRDYVEASNSRTGPIPTIRFGVAVWSGLAYDSTAGAFDYTNAHHNDAPPELTELYAYDFEPGKHSPPQPPASIIASKPTLSKARAGRTFTVSMLVTDSQSGLPAIDVDLACVARVAGKTLPVLQKSVSKAGRAACAWRLPSNSHGKRIRGTITASYPRVRSASRSFAAGIR